MASEDWVAPDSLVPESSEVPNVEEESDSLASITNNQSLTRVQTNTGIRLLPPIIRVERCRCVNCGVSPPDLICKVCKQETTFCKKCARRAKHEHPLKAFRPKDKAILELRKHLTLSYYEHIVSCENDVCLETCEDSRYARIHFAFCQIRPKHPIDMIKDGQVQFRPINGETCSSCGLFITCLFLHANKCRKMDCQISWCQDMRTIFDMESKDIYLISDDVKQQCEEIHKAEWKKVENKRLDDLREHLVEDLMAVEI